MKALTLKRPWSIAVYRYGKDIENRSWLPPARIIGQTIAIHSGAMIEYDGADFFEKVTGEKIPDELPMGILGTAVVAGYTTPEKTKSPWAFGPFCWVLKDPILLDEPIECKGKLGLWNVPEEYERILRKLKAP